MLIPLYIETIKKALSPLDGQTYKSRSELEDAIFPIFGPLTSIFEGEGYRDFVDRLLQSGWVKRDNKGTYMCAIPVEDLERLKPVVAESKPKGTTTAALGNVDPFIPIVRSGGMSEPASELPTLETRKSEAVMAIMRNDFSAAVKILSQLL